MRSRKKGKIKKKKPNNIILVKTIKVYTIHVADIFND